MDDICGAFCENSDENLPCYNSTKLYLTDMDLLMGCLLQLIREKTD